MTTQNHQEPLRRVRSPFANALFFPAAVLYALLIIPLWIAGQLGWIPPLPGLQNPAGHAHEIVFGYAMAVMAGYLMGPQPLRISLPLLIAWLLARIDFLWLPGSWIAALPALIFAAGTAWIVVPRFSSAAKKWRNRMVAPLVATLMLATALAGPMTSTIPPPLTRLVAISGLLMLSLMMFFMGGRILAPALAGHIVSQRKLMPHRVQPRVEGAVILLLLAVLPLPWLAATEVLSEPLADQGMAGLLLACGALIFVRIARWRVWLCRNRPDLLLLVLAYLWLGVGLLLLGLAKLPGGPPESAALHAVGLGGLGGLSLTVMLRTRLIYRYRDPNGFVSAHLASLMISLAALARLGAVWLGSVEHLMLITAAGLWSMAMLLALFPLLCSLRS